jgi:hypothetical protein
MTSTGSIQFTDLGSGDDAWVGIRVEGDRIGLASSLKSDGDIEVFFGRGEAAALRDALTQALALVDG